MNQNFSKRRKMPRYIKRMVRTTKTEQFKLQNKYVFDVDIRLNKQQIKLLFETTFQVNILKVNTLICKLKKRRYSLKTGYLPKYKRAIIKIAPEQNFPF